MAYLYGRRQILLISVYFPCFNYGLLPNKFCLISHHVFRFGTQLQQLPAFAQARFETCETAFTRHRCRLDWPIVDAVNVKDFVVMKSW